MDVYFDDVVMSHTPGQIVSATDYMPFGLAFRAGERLGSTEQMFTYNGKELQNELSLGCLDYGARMYSSELGRFMTIDPHSESYESWTPYNYVADNPINMIDPDGRDWWGAGADAYAQGVDEGGSTSSMNDVSSAASNSSTTTKKTAGPTVAEAARIAAHVYGTYDDSILIGGWKKSKRQIKYVRWNDEHVTGLNSALYERTVEDGTIEYVYATAGTADFKDVIEDISQPAGVTAQYDLSVQNAYLISKDVGAASLTFVGHSLGGGEAAANSYATGRNAMTFNAAGVSEENVKRYSKYNKSQKSGQIDAFILTTDPLYLFQDKHHLLVPTVNGKRDYLKPAGFNGYINGHSIDNLIKAIDKRDKERKK